MHNLGKIIQQFTPRNILVGLSVFFLALSLVTLSVYVLDKGGRVESPAKETSRTEAKYRIMVKFKDEVTPIQRSAFAERQLLDEEAMLDDMQIVLYAVSAYDTADEVVTRIRVLERAIVSYVDVAHLPEFHRANPTFGNPTPQPLAQGGENNIEINDLVDVPTHGQVTYWETLASVGKVEAWEAVGTEHAVPLAGLSPNTMYYFHVAVSPVGGVGTTTTSSVYSFRTAKQTP